MSAVEVYPIDGGPELHFAGELDASLRDEVAAAWEAWHNAGSDADADEGETSEELHERYLEALERYAGVEFK